MLTETAESLSGVERRRFMANTLIKLQLGQREAACLFGWGRDTLRKACHEMLTGLTCADAFCRRGRKPVEFHLPHLFDDLRGLVQVHLQTDPTFQTTGLYCVPTSGPWRFGVVGSCVCQKTSSKSEYEITVGSKVIWTTSACPVVPVQTCS